MSETFGIGYAEVYDAIYHDKDYATECDLVERVLSANAAAPMRRILDLGCGTGRHADLLAERGYEVVGVDRSPHMIEQARARAEKRRSPD
jgi:predicted TPR repeat methyltransferase